MDQEPAWQSQLMRFKCAELAIEDIERAMSVLAISDYDLLRLQDAIRQCDVTDGVRRSFFGERSSSYMACIDPESMPTPGDSSREQVREFSERFPKRVLDAAKMLEFNRRMVAASGQSLSHSLHEAGLIEGELKVIRNSRIGWLCYPITAVVQPNFESLIRNAVKVAAKRDTADAAIAAELFRRKHENWPQKLDQLVPEYLPAVPVDPFSGKPLKMLVTAEGFTVYSVGRDERDDGGKLSKDMTLGTDIGFMIPAK